MTNRLLAATIGLALGLLVAPAALASTVTVTGGNTIRVAETGDQTNRFAVNYNAAANVYSVADNAANLTPSGSCTAFSAHIATCPGTGIKTISVEAGDREDNIGLDTSTIPVSVLGNLNGGGGTDRIGGHGTLSGGSGNDFIAGSPLGDDIRGGSGRDSMDGGDGPDDVAGGRGADTLSYPFGRPTPVNVTVGNGSGNDGGAEDQGIGRRDTVRGDIETVAGTAQADLLSGDSSSENLIGGPGNDTLAGNSGNDQLLGFEGDDLLLGFNGRDGLRGWIGADRLFGGRDGDRVSGGPDNDLVVGNRGSDVLKGKGGIDFLRAKDGIRDVKIKCGPGPNKAEGATRDKRRDPRPKSC
jgi:Ca2+-binding RTX toxin-like protein